MAAVRVRSELGALRHEPHFGRLYATRLVSQASDGMLQVAFAGAVFFNPEHSTDARAAAAGFAVLLLPYSVVGPFAGVLIDRWRRQRILVAASLLRAVVVCGVAALLGTGGPTSAAFFGSALLAVSLNRFYLSSLSAALPHVVRADLLVVANSVSVTSGYVATLLGGLLALALRALAGAAAPGSSNVAVALTAAAGYLLAARVAAGFPDAGLLGPDRPADRPGLRGAIGGVLGEVWAGARHVAARRPAAYAMVAIAAHRFLYGLCTIATLLLYRNFFTDAGVLRAGLVGLGQVVIAGGLGALLAAAATPAATDAIGKPAWITVLLSTAAAVTVGLAATFTMPAVLVAALLLGFVSQGVKISVDSTLQETVDDAVRGRVFAGYDTVFNLTFVAAATLGAAVLPATGRSVAVLAAVGGCYAATALAYGLASRRPSSAAAVSPTPVAAPLGPAAADGVVR